MSSHRIYLILFIFFCLPIGLGCQRRERAALVNEQASGEIISAFGLDDYITLEPVQADELVSFTASNFELAHIDPLMLPTEEIFVVGSTLVHPITQQMSNDFNREGYRGTIQLSQSTTESGIAQFCRDRSIDILNASRRVTREEIATCAANGRELVFYLIGYDQIALVAHEDNFWLRNLEEDQLTQLFSAELWSDLDPTYPKRTVAKYYPEQQGSITQTMVDYAYGDRDANELIDNPAALYYSYDLDLLRDIALDPNGFGFASYASVHTRNQAGLNVIPIDGATPLRPGYYPIRKRLYIVTSEETLRDKPHVATFVAHYLNKASRRLPSLGFAPLPPGMRDTERAKFIKLIDSFNSPSEALRVITIEERKSENTEE